MPDDRRLSDLSGIGKAMLRDFERLGVTDVEMLATLDAQALYEQFWALEGVRPDPCVLDTYACAIAQARDPNLPAEQRDWWWWSRKRKAEADARR